MIARVVLALFTVALLACDEGDLQAEFEEPVGGGLTLDDCRPAPQGFVCSREPQP